MISHSLQVVEVVYIWWLLSTNGGHCGGVNHIILWVKKKVVGWHFTWLFVCFRCIEASAPGSGPGLIFVLISVIHSLFLMPVIKGFSLFWSNHDTFLLQSSVSVFCLALSAQKYWPCLEFYAERALFQSKVHGILCPWVFFKLIILTPSPVFFCFFFLFFNGQISQCFTTNKADSDSFISVIVSFWKAFSYSSNLQKTTSFKILHLAVHLFFDKHHFHTFGRLDIYIAVFTQQTMLAL